MSKIRYLHYSELNDCPLQPAFWRVLAPDGSFLWNHYLAGISRERFLAWYQLTEDTILHGVHDGYTKGLQVRLTPDEFRRVADRGYAGFRFWKLTAFDNSDDPELYMPGSAPPAF